VPRPFNGLCRSCKISDDMEENGHFLSPEGALVASCSRGVVACCVLAGTTWRRRWRRRRAPW
jgi:hypothetical protein